MKTSATIFSNIFDNDTSKRVEFPTFLEFEELLYALSKEPAIKRKKGARASDMDAVLISPAWYADGDTRCNASVIEWTWVALDIDEYGGKFEDILTKFGDFYYVCYSTASSSKAHPKFRLVFPLTSAVPFGDIRHMWHAMNSEFLGIVDAQTKDLSRMYYIPAKYPGAFNFIFTNPGKVVDPKAMMEKHPYNTATDSSNFFDRLPTPIQESLMKHRQSKLSRDGFRWTSYSDCKFVSPKMVSDYKSATAGHYHAMYCFMVSCGFRAVRMGYDINNNELADIARSLDNDTGMWYKDRPLETEADRALFYVFKNI